MSEILNRNIAWIENCDSKTSIVLSGIGIIVGILLATDYIWLLNGEKVPNHSEIARFRSKRLAECGEAFFYQLVEKLSQLGEITFEHLFVDGTKIEANAKNSLRYSRT